MGGNNANTDDLKLSPMARNLVFIALFGSAGTNMYQVFDMAKMEAKFASQAVVTEKFARVHDKFEDAEEKLTDTITRLRNVERQLDRMGAPKP